MLILQQGNKAKPNTKTKMTIYEILNAPITSTEKAEQLFAITEADEFIVISDSGQVYISHRDDVTNQDFCPEFDQLVNFLERG